MGRSATITWVISAAREEHALTAILLQVIRSARAALHRAIAEFEVKQYESGEVEKAHPLMAFDFRLNEL